MKLIRKIILKVLGLIFIFLLLIMYTPFTLQIGYIKDEYSFVIKDANMSGDVKVSEIALLGAHDAFSSQIGLFSKVDPAEEGILTNKAINTFFKGGLVRILKAQNANATILLKRGVRYFDVRISNVEGEWYTKHGFIDRRFSSYVEEVYTFLKDKPSEFIIFDIQHIYLGDKTIHDFLSYFESLTLSSSGLNLNDFINHTTSVEIKDLEYADVRGGDNGGIVLLLNDDGTASFNQKRLFYNRGDGEDNTESIRSKWHNKQKFEDMVPLIDLEASFLRDLVEKPFLRVNQAQLTPDYLKEPINTLVGWSLINAAAKSNTFFLEHENFEDWLEVMPIFMVDFANSRSGHFNKKINEILIEYNKKLST